MENINFLNKKYPDLPGSKPVEHAVQKEKRKGNKTPHEKSERIEAYLVRLEEVFSRRERTKNGKRLSNLDEDKGFNLLKHKVLEKYTTKEEDIPESYWKLQERIMRERGQLGDWENATEEQKNEIKKQNSEGVLADQRSSLEQWVDYFASPDSKYIPSEFKYWVFRNIIGLQEFDKEKKDFPKRSKGTIKQFPDINYEALGYVIDAVIKKLNGQKIEFEYDIQPDERSAFEQSLAKEDFGKLYAWANELMNPIPEHLLPVTDGEWRKYAKGSEHTELVKSIRGKGTGWCTAGENTANKQLEGGDFYIFYSLDDNQKPTIPRVAIRMEGDKIAEVRGVANKQNLDPYMGEVLEKKLDEFPDKAIYLKKDRDMRQLTGVESKTKKGEKLTRDDLTFLYEINAPIEGFGYQKDPRINELREGRDTEEDMLIVFDYTPEDIAHSASEITENTKAYVGKLELGIFQKLPENLKHMYTKFPEGRVKFRNIELGTGITDGQDFIDTMQAQGIHIEYATQLLQNDDFKVVGEHRRADLVEVSVRDLGFNGTTRYDKIVERAKELGLEVCPAEVGPQLRLQYTDQPFGEYLIVAMNAISGRGGGPHVFVVGRDGDGLWLSTDDGRSDDEWRPDYRFVFLRPRK